MDINKNILAVNSIQVDISKGRLEEAFNKKIDEGYLSSPTNDKFVVTQEKSRGKVTFPLILISSILETDSFKTAIINALKNVSRKGEEVLILYKNNNKKAVSLCKAYANKETVLILKDFCLEFKYFITKGETKEDLDFDELLNLDIIGKNILIDDENAEDFTPEVKKEIIADIECKRYQEEIERILHKGKSVNSVDMLINPPTTVVENIENQVIQEMETDSIPTVEEAITPKDDKDAESYKVKAWPL